MHPTTGLKALLVVGIFLLAAILGIWAGELLGVRWPFLSRGGAVWFALAAIALILAAAAFVLALPSTLRFVRCGFAQTRQCAFDLWPSLLFLALGTLAISIPRLSHPTPEGIAPIGIVFGQATTHDAVFLPFFPLEGRSNRCDPNQSDFGAAQNVTGAGVKEAITNLMSSLAACSEGSKQVKIDIRGFASSSDFAGCTMPTNSAQGAPTVSEQLNWRLAEARRRTVIEFVPQASGKIMIEPRADQDRWRSPQDMRNNMRFFDRNADDGYNPAKGGLNRRAEIIILSKGSCEPVE